VECAEDCTWLSGSTKERAVAVDFQFEGPNADENAAKLKRMQQQPSDFRTAAAGSVPKSQGPSVTVGERFRVTGILDFDKRPDGWKANGYSFRRFPRRAE